MQRPWGSTMAGVLQEQRRGSPCVCSRVREGERGRRGGQEGPQDVGGRLHSALSVMWSCREGWAEERRDVERSLAPRGQL